MASFVGTYEEFTKYISPRARNVVNGISRNYKKEIGRCEQCQSTTVTLEAAHITGRERPLIIEEILAEFINGEIVTVDLDVFESKFIEAHNPIEQIIRILCRPCHRTYDTNNEMAIEPLSDLQDVTCEEASEKRDLPLITNSEITSYLRQTIPTLRDSIIINLLDKDYCKQVFNVNFPVLKAIPFDANQEAIGEIARDEKGYIRWSPQNPIERTGSRYLVLTQWYDRNRAPFLRWKDAN